MNTAQSDITLSAGQDISPARENSSPLAWRKTDTMCRAGAHFVDILTKE